MRCRIIGINQEEFARLKCQKYVTFYIEGFELDIEDIERIINERNDLREEKHRFYDFIDENENIINQFKVLSNIHSDKKDNQIEDYTRTLGVIFTRKFIEYLNKI